MHFISTVTITHVHTNPHPELMRICAPRGAMWNTSDCPWRIYAAGRGGWVAERKYELDSGAYYLSMLWNYFNTPGLFGAERFLNESLLFDAAQLMVDTWRTEQHHEERSPFVFPLLPRDGKGSPTKYTGARL